MHEIWTISTINMPYITFENYTNMVIGEHV